MGIISYIIIFIAVLLILSGLFIVKQQTSAIIERFGRFLAIRQSGLHIKIPLIDRIAGRMSLKILQLDVIVETKTKDDVFVKLKVSVQYKVLAEKVYMMLFTNLTILKIKSLLMSLMLFVLKCQK